MPADINTRTEGGIAAWHKHPGDKLSMGDKLLDLEFDGKRIPVPSFQNAALLHIFVEAGQKIPVGAAIAVIGQLGEDFSSLMEIQRKETFADRAPSAMRKTIAQRLVDSKAAAPHFYLDVNVRMDRAARARGRLNSGSGSRISYNDIVVQAAAHALRKWPPINRSWIGGKIRTYGHVHIGMVVAIPDGMLIPVIRFADEKSLQQIAAESRQLAQLARTRQLPPSELDGATFTISNLGGFGIDSFTAIINQPNACILAVGAVRDAPVVDNGQLTVGKVMSMKLSCDHRLVDGADGAGFLRDLRQWLEDMPIPDWSNQRDIPVA